MVAIFSIYIVWHILPLPQTLRLQRVWGTISLPANSPWPTGTAVVLVKILWLKYSDGSNITITNVHRSKYELWCWYAKDFHHKESIENYNQSTIMRNVCILSSFTSFTSKAVGHDYMYVWYNNFVTRHIYANFKQHLIFKFSNTLKHSWTTCYYYVCFPNIKFPIVKAFTN